MAARYLLTLALTLIIEGCVAYLAGLRERKYALAIATINVATHPLLNYLLLLLGYLGIDVTLALVVVLEVLVVIAEWQLLVYAFGQPRGRFLIASFLANGASFLVGLVLFWT
jgi:hypothetical protein